MCPIRGFPDGDTRVLPVVRRVRVRHEENGLLVPPADPAALAQAILQLADNPDEAFRMGQRGRRRVEEEFTLEKKILETESLCASFLQGRATLSRTAHA